MTTSHLFSAKIATLLSMSPGLQWLLIHQRTVLDQNTLWADAKAGQYARLVDGLISPLLRSGRMLQAICFQFENECHLIVIHRDFCLGIILPDPGDLLDQIASSALAVLESCDEVIRRSAGLEPLLSPVVNEPVVALAKVTGIKPQVTKPQVARAAVAQSQITRVQFGKPVAQAVEDTKHRVTKATVALAAAEPELTEESPAKLEPDSEPAWNSFRNHLLEVLGKILSRPQAERLLAIELKALGIEGVPAPSDFERIGRVIVAHVPNRCKQAALLKEVLHFLKL